MESKRPFTTSIGFIIVITIFLQFVIILLALEVAHHLAYWLENAQIDCERGEVNARGRRDEVDTWLLDTATGEPLPEYSVVDTTPPPPYKEDEVDLGVFIVEFEDGGNK
jgi:hypothetical protein